MNIEAKNVLILTNRIQQCIKRTRAYDQANIRNYILCPKNIKLIQHQGISKIHYNNKLIKKTILSIATERVNKIQYLFLLRNFSKIELKRNYLSMI